MRLGLCIVVFAFSLAAHASSTLRVGNQVLVAGDSSARVEALLGRPLHKLRQRQASSGSRRRGGVRVVTKPAGERWQYRRGDHVTVVTIVDGRVTDIDDRRL